MKLHEAQKELISDLEIDLKITLTNSEKSAIRQFLVRVKKCGEQPPKWLRENPEELKKIAPELTDSTYFNKGHIANARSLYLYMYLDEPMKVYNLGLGGNVPKLKEKFRKARDECFLL